MKKLLLFSLLFVGCLDSSTAPKTQAVVGDTYIGRATYKVDGALTDDVTLTLTMTQVGDSLFGAIFQTAYVLQYGSLNYSDSFHIKFDTNVYMGGYKGFIWDIYKEQPISFDSAQSRGAALKWNRDIVITKTNLTYSYLSFTGRHTTEEWNLIKQ